jgi:hypothetical protein
MRPSQTILVLEKLRNSSEAHLRRKGVELSLDDTQTVLDVYQQWLLLSIDLGYLHPESLERTAQRLWSDMIRMDVFDLNSAFADCLRLVQTKSVRGFKALCKRISSHLYPLIKADLERVSLGDVYSAKRLVQLFSYTGRLSLVDLDLTQQMLDDYMEIEGSISDDYPDSLIRRLNKIIRRWMGPFVPDEIRPGHGPGGVAGHGRVSLEVKYKDLTTDAQLEYAFGEPHWSPGSIRSSLDRISKTIFVPKSYKTFRTISMEPATLQYFQQGVWKVIDSQVAKSRYLRNRIGFHDQTRNQLLAKEGSIDRNYATIDLSAASDSVSYSLVKKLFRGTWLLRFAVTLRSPRTLLPDGRLIELKKFAPMGSALCFPFETIIFAAICELVTREHRLSGRYSVFGDDIIVPTQCVDKTMNILETLGFRVNRDKSFYASDCWFRESCGAEYCDGFDVTPMRVSRQYASRERLVRLTKLIDLANNAYKRGFRNLRHFFLKKLRSNKFIALFSPTEILADSYTNYHARRRWNHDLHRIDVEATTLSASVSEEARDSQDEDIRYRHWLESTNGRKSLGDGFKSVICKPTVKTKSAWRTKPYESLDQDFIDFFAGRGINSPR